MLLFHFKYLKNNNNNNKFKCSQKCKWELVLISFKITILHFESYKIPCIFDHKLNRILFFQYPSHFFVKRIMKKMQSYAGYRFSFTSLNFYVVSIISRKKLQTLFVRARVQLEISTVIYFSLGFV